ncbi:respiratory chain complex I subunit 1 family protein [Catenulispora subtropica]|uniref:Respiratory chain complex I subunit 1 family protein n=1 Tax=Catenulispora subtropica TaxID=450798 RepID=A0ABP5CJU7_9ACTN
MLQVGLIVVGAPLLTGLMRQVRARMEGRSGAGIGQPWRDLRKLMRKKPLAPDGTGPVFRTGPLVQVSTTLMAAAAIPFVSVHTGLGGAADLIAVVALLTLGTATLALAGLDTGTAFGGMGASREMTITALAEPTVLMATFALSTRVGSTNLPAIVDAGLKDAGRVVSPVSVLAAFALAAVVLAEAGRLPVDNPSTHLELTMVHEAMVLEYSGPDLALVELAASMRLAVLLGLWSALFLPWGTATATGALPVAGATGLFVLKVGVLGAGLAAAEVFMAKLRLFRVPELLAGSFLLAVLAVSASFFL